MATDRRQIRTAIATAIGAALGSALAPMLFGSSFDQSIPVVGATLFGEDMYRFFRSITVEQSDQRFAEFSPAVKEIAKRRRFLAIERDLERDDP